MFTYSNLTLVVLLLQTLPSPNTQFRSMEKPWESFTECVNMIYKWGNVLYKIKIQNIEINKK
jgi:hypothetical protein